MYCCVMICSIGFIKMKKQKIHITKIHAWICEWFNEGPTLQFEFWANNWWCVIRTNKTAEELMLLSSNSRRALTYKI